MTNKMLLDRIRVYILTNKLLCFAIAFASISFLYYNNKLLHLFNVKKDISTIPIHPKSRSCYKLQNSIDSIISQSKSNWTISILDENRNLISSVNPYKPLIPASNIKLITTAYALHKLNRNFKLKTKLILRGDGMLEIWGEGDPDLRKSDIKQLSKDISNIFSAKDHNSNSIKVLLYEEPSANWWSDTWSIADRRQSYGSPITRLAIQSNATEKSNQYPLESFQSYLSSQIRSFGLSPYIINKPFKSRKIYFLNRKIINQIESAPFNSLLSLANSESHNFTAEILLRHAANNWNPKVASREVYKWLLSNRIPVDEFVLVDGSGLSRENKATSIGIASLLWFMDNEKGADLYRSSMSILGVRGTLRGFEGNSDIDGNFHGKTGTLTGVRAISGILNTINGKRYIGIVSNNVYQPDILIKSILEVTAKFSQCS